MEKLRSASGAILSAYLFFKAKSEPPKDDYLENLAYTLCATLFEKRKRLAESFLMAKGKMIQRRGFASHYGLLCAFWRVFILWSVVPN